MTQAFNLSQFANNLNTSGATSNTGLQNSAVTVTAGTGMSGGGSVALGSSVTLTNAGVTSIVAGTGISVSGATGAVTVTNTSSASGTVTSVATGNGLSGGTITGSGTLVIAAPTAVSVGSYAIAIQQSGGTIASNSTTTGGNLPIYYVTTCGIWGAGVGNLSGTWRNMTGASLLSQAGGIWCRVS